MIVSCEQCAARYKLDDSKIRGRGARITCPRCQHVFIVYTQPSPTSEPREGEPPGPSNEEAAPSGDAQAPAASRGQEDRQPESPPPPPEPAEKRTAESLDFRKVGIQTWKVKVKIGLVYDFSDIQTLRKYIKDKRVTPDDSISHDGKSWTRIGDISDLDEYFLLVYEEHEAGLEARDEDEFGDDGPTMIVDAANLRKNTSTGVFATKEEAPQPEPKEHTGPDFVDPFVALKAQQKQRSKARSKARAGADQRGSKRSRPSPKAKRPWLIPLGAVLLIGLVALVLLRPDGQPAPAVPAPYTSTTPDAGEQERARQQVNELLQQRFADSEGLEPLDLDPDPEPEELYRPVIPRSAQRTTAPPTASPGTSGRAAGTTSSAVVQAPTTARDHAAAGEGMAASGDWAGAAQAYSKAVAMDGSNAAYRLKYGEALYRSGSLDGARAQLSQVSSTVATAHRVLGHISRDQGDDSGAVYHYREYLKTNPPDSASIEGEIQRLTGG